MSISAGQLTGVAVQMHTMTGLLRPGSPASITDVHRGLGQYMTTLRRARVPVRPYRHVRRFAARYIAAYDRHDQVGRVVAARQAILGGLRAASYLPLDGESDDSFLQRLDGLIDPRAVHPSAMVEVGGVRLYIGHAVAFAGVDGSGEFDDGLRKPLVDGGTAELSEVTHSATGAKLVLKEYRGAKRTFDLLTHVLSEMRFQCGPACRSLLPVYRGGNNDDGRYYVLMPHIDEVVKNMADESTGARYNTDAHLLSVIEAVAVLHDSGILHGDLTFSNVMMDKSGRVLLADAGEAMTVDESKRFAIRSGSVGYLPPERLFRNDIFAAKLTARDNVFSLGVILFQMITGHRPFSNALAREWTLSEISGHVLYPVIKKALSGIINDRYSDAREMYEAAAAIVGGQGK